MIVHINKKILLNQILNGITFKNLLSIVSDLIGNNSKENLTYFNINLQTHNSLINP